MTVLTVTLNLALDVTYGVRRLRPGSMHRVAEPAQRAGGKGVNVARVLHALGEPVIVTGLSGGSTGRGVDADLEAAGIPADLVEIAAETRRTLTVVDGEAGEATLFNEPGPPVSEAEWNAFLARYKTLAGEATVVVLSGSLPRGLPEDAYATLIRATTTPVILDADGRALRLGAAAGPRIVKPNAAELAAATGESDPRTGALKLGAGAVVVSRGPGGMTVYGESDWSAVPPRDVRGNATGAGDAAVAALARGLAAGSPWPDRLADAVALSAAAVAAPLAGDFDAGLYATLRAQVRAVPLP